MQAERILEQLKQRAPDFAARAAAAEGARTLPEQSVRDLLDAGVARILVPKRYGGYALDFEAWLEAARIVAMADASHGWCASIITHHAHMAAQFPEAAQNEIWRDGPDVAIAASVAPALDVARADGGYVISGKHSSFASGVNHSQWAILGGLVHGEGAPEWTFFLVPAKDYSIQDDWRTTAMRGTGSNTIITDRVFVADGFTLTLADLRSGEAPGAPREESYIYRTPFFFYAPLSFVMPMLGAAQGAYEAFRDSTRTRMSPRAGRVAESASLQTRMARTAADLDAAQMLLARATAAAKTPGDAPGALQARCARDFSRAAELSVAAIDTLVNLGGTSGFGENSAVQRAWRDIHLMAMHVSLNADINYSHFARKEFGLDPDPAQPFFV